MAKDSKGFSNSIGGSGGASAVGSSSIGEGDGRREKIDPNKGAGANLGQKGGGAYGAPNAVLKVAKSPLVRGAGPSPSRPVAQPTSRSK